mmetsp:Transcript_87785/g.155661  ORF Transcript_87785/g.155661 Transcript_87785/m.155661 type:complete len:231 (+) Transcript_87785:66-758(+)|eukprot:CAMPEP_0197651564 /NCGR_PEP_ID=MMETSP1338-20131121/33086_1 /TAXON_ID=43686 ORGANISM="Pelagodinium beii, Strain RCC1491" /NCGR_SAMPLE_ID=MMETSP1338 /ASSEMBLY_ACC=CAM_ASM_000754 /LENGTH=230 /DNA_ID=CAMNT_0043226231 /DNA_START=62 /DNA_END=754 /DNA_ORIENTATION=-
MVYFECQKCNETIKKPKLAKHLQSCGSWYVSCIDCSKVFSWEEWEAHTSCMSEAQKYQGKLFQGKEKENKGQAKQDSWVENVGKAVADPSADIPDQIRTALQNLMGYDNIPRKQKPFGNFVKNSLKIWDQSKIDAMWNVIASANVKPAAGSSAPKVEEKKWSGWKHALDAELQAAGGSMPWKKLKTQLVKLYRDAGEGKGASDEDLGQHALAAIPEGYCCECTEVVKLAK